jgi:hypothetical protein
MARGRRLKKGGGDLEAQKQNVDPLQQGLGEQNVAPSELRPGEQNIAPFELRFENDQAIMWLIIDNGDSLQFK